MAFGFTIDYCRDNWHHAVDFVQRKCDTLGDNFCTSTAQKMRDFSFGEFIKDNCPIEQTLCTRAAEVYNKEGFSTLVAKTFSKTQNWAAELFKSAHSQCNAAGDYNACDKIATGAWMTKNVAMAVHNELAPITTAAEGVAGGYLFGTGLGNMAQGKIIRGTLQVGAGVALVSFPIYTKPENVITTLAGFATAAAVFGFNGITKANSEDDVEEEVADEVETDEQEVEVEAAADEFAIKKDEVAIEEDVTEDVKTEEHVADEVVIKEDVAEDVKTEEKSKKKLDFLTVTTYIKENGKIVEKKTEVFDNGTPEAAQVLKEAQEINAEIKRSIVKMQTQFDNLFAPMNAVFASPLFAAPFFGFADICQDVSETVTGAPAA